MAWRRCTLRALPLLVAAACLRAHAAAPSAALLTDSVFGAASFWYAPIPRAVRLSPDSARFTRELLRQVAHGKVTLNTRAYASPVFVAGPGARTAGVQPWDCQQRGTVDPGLRTQWQAVPIPAYARPSAGTDHEMTIYQPSTDTLWEFWQARVVDGQWQACWGGRLQQVSRSGGTWPHPYGATATGLPFLGGQVTAEELARGEIRHAIGIALPDLEHAKVFRWPASRSDGDNPGGDPDRIPAGTRFRLDPALDIAALKLHPVAATIARAAQKYGFVVWDRAGVVSVRMQNSLSYTALGHPDPYLVLFRGVPEYAVMDRFPWAAVQFVESPAGPPPGPRK